MPRARAPNAKWELYRDGTKQGSRRSAPRRRETSATLSRTTSIMQHAGSVASSHACSNDESRCGGNARGIASSSSSSSPAHDHRLASSREAGRPHVDPPALPAARARTGVVGAPSAVDGGITAAEASVLTGNAEGAEHLRERESARTTAKSALGLSRTGRGAGGASERDRTRNRSVGGEGRSRTSSAGSRVTR